MSTSEKALQTDLCKQLNYAQATKFITFHGTPMTEKGTPDLIGSVHGFMVVVELKDDEGKLSKIQEYRLEQWSKTGALAFSCRTKHEAYVKIAKFCHDKGKLWP